MAAMEGDHGRSMKAPMLGEKEHNADFEGSNLQKEREKGEFLTFEGFSFPFYEEQFVHI